MTSLITFARALTFENHCKADAAPAGPVTYTTDEPKEMFGDMTMVQSHQKTGKRSQQSAIYLHVYTNTRTDTYSHTRTYVYTYIAPEGRQTCSKGSVRLCKIVSGFEKTY